MLGVVCGALNVADAAFRTCMTDFLHLLERCGGGLRSCAVGAGDTGSACPKGRLAASLETQVLLSLGCLPSHFCCKSFANLEAVALQQQGSRGICCDSQRRLLSHHFIWRGGKSFTRLGKQFQGKAARLSAACFCFCT